MSILQSLVYVGGIFGFFLYPYIADNYGRKIALNLSWGTCVLGILILGVSYHLAMVGVGLFLSGFGANPAITLHYSFVNEQATGKARQLISVGFQVTFALGEILIAVVYWVSKSWRFNTLVFLLAPAVLCQILHILLV